MTRLLFKITLLSCLSLGFWSCDTDESIPAYLIVDSVDFETKDEEGAATHKIQDVWVFIDGQAIGVWPLPAKIPTFGSQESVEITFFAGIRADGITEKARIYPFYESIVVDQVLLEGEEYNFDLSFKYFDFTKFEFIEGFETRNIFSIDNDGDPNTKLVRSQDDPITGDFCGYIHLRDTADFVDIVTQFEYSRDDIQGGSAYLEIDYKCDIPIVIGYITESGSLLVEDINNIIVERDEWNKIYIDLSSILTDISIDTYKIKIGSSLQSSGLSVGNIYVDNIKLVHF